MRVVAEASRGSTFGLKGFGRFVYQPAEAQFPGETEPHQLRELLSGGSLRVG